MLLEPHNKIPTCSEKCLNKYARREILRNAHPPGFPSLSAKTGRVLLRQSLDENLLHLLRQLLQFRDPVSEFVVLAFQLVRLYLHLQKPVFPRLSRTLRRYVVLLPSLQVLCCSDDSARGLLRLRPGAAFRRRRFIELLSFLIHEGIVVVGDGRECTNFTENHVVRPLLVVLCWLFVPW